MRVLTEQARAAGFVCVQKEICSVRGCGRRAMWASEMCEDCASMDRELDLYWSQQERAKREKLGYRLRTIALLSAFVTLMSWLAIAGWPQLWVMYQIWKAGN